MQNQKTFRFDSGSSGIGTFLSDSAMWQRGAPHPSDMNCFYGVTMPLLMRGVPVDAPHLDRAAEPGYLDRYRLLFVSYDIMKPMRPDINQALAEWTRRGGCLIVLGGEDPYNAVPAWWRERGFESPQDHLLSLCGFDVSRRRVLKGIDTKEDWKVVARTEYAGRGLGNQTTEEINLTPFLKTGTVLIKCEDSLKDDGWGAFITRLSAKGIRGGKPVTVEFRTNTPAEREQIAFDNHTGLTSAGARFCDSHYFVIYRFDFDPKTKATLSIEIGNQYIVSAAPGSGDIVRKFETASDVQALGASALNISPLESIVIYEGSKARPLYTSRQGALLTEKTVGKGAVLFFGAAPSWFARSPEAAEQLRALARYAIEEKLGDTFREQGYLKLVRGRYVIAKTFDESLELRGRYVNCLDSRLPLVSAVSLAPEELAVLYDAEPDMDGEPKLLFASSCVEWKSEGKNRLRLIVSGASGVFGVCRVLSAGRGVESIRATAADGRKVEVEVKADRETVLLRYPNEPFGLAVDIVWGQ